MGRYVHGGTDTLSQARREEKRNWASRFVSLVETRSKEIDPRCSTGIGRAKQALKGKEKEFPDMEQVCLSFPVYSLGKIRQGCRVNLTLQCKF